MSQVRLFSMLTLALCRAGDSLMAWPAGLAWFEIHQVNLVRSTLITSEEKFSPIWIEGRKEFVARNIGQLFQALSVSTHRVEVKIVAAAIRTKHDRFSVGRPGGMQIKRFSVGYRKRFFHRTFG